MNFVQDTPCVNVFSVRNQKHLRMEFVKILAGVKNTIQGLKDVQSAMRSFISVRKDIVSQNKLFKMDVKYINNLIQALSITQLRANILLGLGLIARNASMGSI